MALWQLKFYLCEHVFSMMVMKITIQLSLCTFFLSCEEMPDEGFLRYMKGAINCFKFSFRSGYYRFCNSIQTSNNIPITYVFIKITLQILDRNIYI